jgi:hypothetical protein
MKQVKDRMLRYLQNHNDRGLARLITLVVVLGALSAIHGCEQPTDAPINNQSEIDRFMELSPDIQELFEFNVYERDTFVLDSGDATFRVAKIDDKRQYSKGVSPGENPIITSIGTARYAIARRVDRYDGKFTQQNSPGSNQTESIYQAELERQALFLKLGSVNDPFLGWEFVGFDLGKPLSNVSEFVTIKRFPLQQGFPTIMSDFQQETGLPPDKRNFTFLFNIEAVKGGDSIDIRTKRGPMTIFARTNVGFRQIFGRHNVSDPANVFHYGYRTPPADPQNQLYHLLTFQLGPEETIDSTQYQSIIAAIDTTLLIPPDTQIVPRSVPDTLFVQNEVVLDTCGDSFVVDTTVFDICFVIENDGVDTILTSKVVFETVITTQLFDTLYDSILLPPDTSEVQEDLWVFPYRVIR